MEIVLEYLIHQDAAIPTKTVAEEIGVPDIYTRRILHKLKEERRVHGTR